MSQPSAELYLRKGADRRLRAGHLWVYSNEVDSKKTSLGQFQAGDMVCVRGADGTVLGSAYMEPQSLICGRVYALRERRELDSSLLEFLIGRALASRQAAFDKSYYRLVYGDSDYLPGLIVDRFGDYLVVQLNNAGIERFELDIFRVLIDLLQPVGILLRADSRGRKELGLADRKEVVHGDVPRQLELEENGVRFIAPVWDGQKTGWFYDHRMSRARLAAHVSGKDVLDVYSYIGGWGIQAAAFGANSVCCLDSSGPALDGVMENARLNNLEAVVSTSQGSAAETMTAMQVEGQSFDVVILDPPAFVQRRKDLKKGIAAYRKINELGLRLLRPGGVLVSGSCSMHLSRADLTFAIQGAANRAGAQLQIIEQGAQGPDHPIHPAIPETEYLKAIFARRLS
ncbi:MAG: RlmI/RlmK family 23S rRNA methyltransferase [Gammaproteobacteria bacterium]|nr:MAG: RlmI/RlmK family 23S rRNA methyltransferase [Gammaproteobacteria bacterium]